MVLESTFICVDDSEYMRNGDFLPSRLQAQQDAVGMITQAKLRSNPESNVGLMALGSLEVLVTLTTDTGRVLAKAHSLQPKGKMMLIPGIKIAHLALKHRLGKNHKTRIVAFVGSPIEAEEKELLKLAKKLKKEKVNVDVVSFGEDEVNADILQKFVETVNGKDGSSHLVTIPPGPHLSDALVSSPIMQGEDGGQGVVSAGGGFEFGVDPNEDPELALALRVSMEEQRARQEAQTGGAQTEAQPAAGAEATPAAPAATATAAGGKEAAATGEDEALLQRALEMSMETDTPAAATTTKEPDLAAMTEEEQIAYAMRMSMQEDAAAASGNAESEKMEVDEPPKASGGDDDYAEAMNDPAFLQSVLENLPGVDPRSEEVKHAVGAMTGSSSGSSDSKDKKAKEKEDDKDKIKK